MVDATNIRMQHDNKIIASAQVLAPDDLLKLGLPSVHPNKWNLLDAIFWRPWFTRV